MVKVSTTVKDKAGGSIVLDMGSKATSTEPDENSTESAATRGGREHVEPTPGPTDQNGAHRLVTRKYTEKAQQEPMLLCK